MKMRLDSVPEKSVQANDSMTHKSRLYVTNEQLKIVCSDFVFVMSLWFVSLEMYFVDVRLGGPPDASCTCGHGNCVER